MNRLNIMLNWSFSGIDVNMLTFSFSFTEKSDNSDPEVSIDFPLLIFISKGNVSVEIVENDL